MKADFTRRSTQPELMDSESVSYEEFKDCLGDLEKINMLTLAYGPTLRWMRRHARNGSFILWDIGSGGGDMLRRLWKKNANSIRFTGIDINPWSKKAAEEFTPPGAPIDYLTADAFALGGAARPDFIISSLFTHHLGDDALVRFLRWMDGTAQRGWFINDLHRHPVPYYFIKHAAPLLSRNRLIRHDAPVSVARAFSRRDWQALLERAGIPSARYAIRWHFPFRYAVGCITNGQA